MIKRFFATLLPLVCAIPAYGQSNYAVLTGTITDSQHLAVSGASIELTDINTGAVRRTATNQLGLFEIQGLLPDDYQLRVEAAGFATANQAVRLEVGQKSSVNIVLEVGSVAQGVKVIGGSDVLKTADTSLGEVIEPTSDPRVAAERPHAD